MVLKCHFHPSTILNNKGKLHGLLAYLYHLPCSTVVFEFCTFQMSRSGIRRKHVANAIQLRRISRPASPTYKEGPFGRANGCATHNAYKKRYQGPHVSLPEKDKDERWPGGAGRPPGRPNLAGLPSRCISRRSWPQVS